MPEVRVQDEQGTVHVFPDGSTPQMIANAMGVRVSAPDPATSPMMASHTVTAPYDSPSFGERMGEAAGLTRHPLQQLSSELGQLASDPVGTLKKTVVAPLIGARDLAYSLATHPIDTLQQATNAPQFAEDLEHKNWSGAAGSLAGTLLPFLAMSPEARAAGKSAIAPVVRTAAKVADSPIGRTAIGAAAGGEFGHPYIGAAIGNRMPFLRGLENYGLDEGPKPIAPTPQQIRMAAKTPMPAEFETAPNQVTSGIRPSDYQHAPADIPEMQFTDPNARDVIAANPGERARQMAAGVRGQAPLTVLPSQNRGLQLTGEAPTAPAVQPAPTPLPWRRQVEKVADEAVRGAGGTPEAPAAPTPGQPIYRKPATSAPPAQEIPPFTPVTSSALSGAHYDAPSRTMTVQTKAGAMYRYGEVAPEEFTAFQKADSPGKAFQAIKNNHVLTEANYGQGWVKKAESTRSGTPEQSRGKTLPFLPKEPLANAAD